jgi:hypothetical protein
MARKLITMEWRAAAGDCECMKCRAPIRTNEKFTFIMISDDVGLAPGDFCKSCADKLWGYRRMRNYDESIFCEGMISVLKRFNESLAEAVENNG